MAVTKWINTGGGTLDWHTAGNWDNGVPNSTTDAVFDAASFSADGTIITFSALAKCKNIVTTGVDQTFTIQSSVYSLEVYGSTTLTNKLTVTFTGTAYWYNKSTGAETITQGGSTLTLNRLYFNGVGGSWTNQDAFNVGNTNIMNKAGTWDTNGFEITTTSTSGISPTTNAAIFTFGSSTLNMVIWNGFASDYTINAGTSILNISGTTFYGQGKTFYDVNFTSNVAINGVNTFHNLTRIGTAAINNSLSLVFNQTVTGTLTITGNNATNNRLLIRCSSVGIQKTLTSANNAITNCDFRDIKGAGAGSWDFSAVEIGDCGGNSDITFRAGESRYYYQNTGNFHDAKWFSATGGGGSAVGMPLPQDTAVFNADSFSGGSTLTIANARIGSLDMSAVDSAVALSLSNSYEVYGNYVLGNNITWNFGSNLPITLLGRGNYNLTAYAVNIYQILVNCLSGKYTCQSNLNTTYDTGSATGSIYITSGTIDFNDYNIKTSFLFQNGGTLYLGDGIIECNKAVDGYLCYFSGTFYGENSTLKLNPTGGSNRNVFLNNKTYNNIWFSGSHTGSFLVTGANTFNNIKADAGKTIKFTAGTTTNFASLTAIGTSVAPITITSVTAATHTLNYTGVDKVQCHWLNVSYSTVVQTDMLYAGAESTDSGNNINWIFGNILGGGAVAYMSGSMYVGNGVIMT